MKSYNRNVLMIFWLLALHNANSAYTQTLCSESSRVTNVEIRFDTPVGEIPPSFTAVNDARRLEIQVTRTANVTWRGRSANGGVVGNQDKLRLNLKLLRYNIIPSFGFNQLLEGKCFAVYKFNAKQISWALEVEGNPESPFQYRKSVRENWTPREPRPQMRDWNLIDNLGMDDSLDIRVYELNNSKQLYLFTLPDVRHSRISQFNLDQAKIAENIIRERAPLIHNKFNLAPSNPTIDKDDPYLQLLMRSRTSLEEDFLKTKIASQINLRGLKLADTSEVSP